MIRLFNEIDDLPSRFSEPMGKKVPKASLPLTKPYTYLY